MRATFIDNPSYVHYVQQIIRLHSLMADGRGDDNEADALRERMDDSWRHLSAEEMERAGMISADLDMLVQDEVFRSVPPEQRKQEYVAPRLTEAWGRNDWATVIALLRTGPPYLFEREEIVAYLRARCYGELGHYDLAFRFLDYAAHLSPKNPNYPALALSALVQAGNLDEALKRARIALQDPAVDVKLLLQASTVLYQSSIRLNEETARPRYGEVVQHMRRAIARSSELAPGVRGPLMAQAWIILGTCLEHLGDASEARLAYDEALKLQPRNDLARLSRGLLPSELAPAPQVSPEALQVLREMPAHALENALTASSDWLVAA